MTTKVCNHCGKEKDEEEFNWRFRSLGIRNPACRDCQQTFNKDYYEGDAKERHLQQVKEGLRPPVKLQGIMSTSIFSIILVRVAII